MAVNSAIMLISPSNRTLLLKNAYGKLGWSTPGGGIDKGETPYMAAIRELFEETSILLSTADIEDIKSFVYINTKIFVVTLLVNARDLEIELSHEHSKFAWVKLDDLSLYDLEKYCKNSFIQAFTLGLIGY